MRNSEILRPAKQKIGGCVRRVPHDSSQLPGKEHWRRAVYCKVVVVRAASDQPSVRHRLRACGAVGQREGWIHRRHWHAREICKVDRAVKHRLPRGQERHRPVPRHRYPERPAHGTQRRRVHHAVAHRPPLLLASRQHLHNASRGACVRPSEPKLPSRRHELGGYQCCK